MILITGLPRSGTSLVSGIFSACGADFGDVCGPTAYNTKGQFENNRIRDKCIKRILCDNGFDRLGKDPIPHESEDFDNTIISEDLGVEAFKDPKLLLVWRVWERSFPDAKWIIVNRDYKSTVASISKVHWFNDTAISLLAMQYELYKAELSMSVRCAFDVWTDDIIDGDFTIVRKVVESCGYHWNHDAVIKWVDNSLWHSLPKE